MESLVTPKGQSINRVKADMQKLCILGLGYIGLPTACLFATHGYQVVGVDRDETKLEAIKQGIPPFDETGLTGC